MWKYNGEEIKEISQFPHNTFGFVYRIFNKKTGKAYIGKKVLYHNIKKKLTKKAPVKKTTAKKKLKKKTK